MGRKRVGLVKYENRRENVAWVVERIGGLDSLRPGDRVLLKPNLVMWDSVYPFPKYGVLTTSLVVEEMVRLLKDYGCKDIAVGEGSIVDPGIGSDTKAAYAGLGYHKLRDKYGVTLIDFNDGPFTEMDFGGYKLDISSHVLESDFLINLPVLKTHSSTKVSLGLKNLKGCLHFRSKMFCHHEEYPLDGFISRLAANIPPSLTVIDGLYALEKGPVINGRAYRTDLLIASKDPFAADAAGARVLGYSPADITHIREFGELQGVTEADVDYLGEPVESVTTPLAWDWEWLPDNSGPEAFERLGIRNVCFPKYDHTLCSGCAYLNNYLLISLIGAHARRPFSDMEFLGGKNCLSGGDYKKSFLFGKCALRANKNNSNIVEAVLIRGCPPAKEDIIGTLKQHGILADDTAYAEYRTALYRRYRNSKVFQENDFDVM